MQTVIQIAAVLSKPQLNDANSPEPALDVVYRVQRHYPAMIDYSYTIAYVLCFFHYVRSEENCDPVFRFFPDKIQGHPPSLRVKTCRGFVKKHEFRIMHKLSSSADASFVPLTVQEEPSCEPLSNRTCPAGALFSSFFRPWIHSIRIRKCQDSLGRSTHVHNSIPAAQRLCEA